jgi:hypothetical protein
MREVLDSLIGLSFISAGYLYPFVVLFRNGTYESVVGKSWAMFITMMIVVSLGVPSFVAMVDPVLAEKMLVEEWVPDSPAIVPIMVAGWIPALIGGAVGQFARGHCLRWFPGWMNRISLPFAAETLT